MATTKNSPMNKGDITKQLNADKLKERINSKNFKEKLMSAAYADLKFTRLQALPGAINSGAATELTLPLFQQSANHNLPAGQYCQTCHESAGRLYQEVVNGKPIRQCISCKENKMNLQENETFSLKFILPPLTSSPINLIFPLIRQSCGGKFHMGNLRMLYSFVRNWCGIPNHSTHVQWIVDIFASHASALSLHSDMVWSLSKFPDSKTNKEMFEPISHLLPQIRATMRMNFDSVTIAVPTMATFSVKTNNLEQFLFDASQFGIPQKDIFFVMYGTEIENQSVKFDPICKSGTDILTDIKELKCIPGGEIKNCKEKWLRKLDINCEARLVSSGLDPGRTCGGGFKNFTKKDIAEARQQVEDESK